MKKGEKGFFALADLYGGGGQALIGVLYFYFLTNVIGLKPALAGVVTLIAEIWDAVSDPLMLTAQGITVIGRIGIRKDADKVLALVREYGCETIVMGLPLNLDGSDSVQTEKVRAFRTMLENKMRSTSMKGIEIVWQDERFTTKMAEAVLIDGDVSRKKRKNVIDKQAAVLILQSYLDSRPKEQVQTSC